MPLFLGIDLGTSYFKLALFDEGGRCRGLGRVPVETDTGDGSLCELAVDRFWASLRNALSESLQQAGADSAEIQGVAYSSQANSFLLLDEDHQPLTPLVLWPDMRASDVDPRVQALWERDDFLDVTGAGVVTAGYAMAKLCWFQRHRPDLWARVRRVQTISDYLVSSLTGSQVGDGGTAGLLGLVDLRRCDWWDEALEALAIDRALLSALQFPGTLAGKITAQGAERLGLRPGTPMALGSLDHHVAAIGAGVGRFAQFSESTGTVLACLRCTDAFEPKRDCFMGSGVAGRDYYQLSCDHNGAGALEWYQQTHAPQLSIAELVGQAESVPIGSGGLVALPGANEHPDLEGFRHRTAQHGDGHFARAILESTAASLSGIVDALCPTGRPERIVATGGGARSDLWLQIKADLLGVEFVRPACREPACLGAAMLASVATGRFENFQQAGTAWTSIEGRFLPDPEAHEAYSHWHDRNGKALAEG